MLKKLQTKEKGFTIIEVLIVLAVGGLIIAIVLLAVPALQRNQRNSARGTDAGRVATAASSFASDNNGTLPKTAADLTIVLKDAGTLGQYASTADAPMATALTPAAKTFSVQTTAVTAPTTEDTLILATGNKCSTGGSTTTTGANSRQMALVYTVETANGFKAVCKDV